MLYDIANQSLQKLISFCLGTFTSLAAVKQLGQVQAGDMLPNLIIIDQL